PAPGRLQPDRPRPRAGRPAAAAGGVDGGPRRGDPGSRLTHGYRRDRGLPGAGRGAALRPDRGAAAAAAATGQPPGGADDAVVPARTGTPPGCTTRFAT